MRRWLLMFVLVVLPLQSVWGAAARYCLHERTDAAKQHFGHHEHRHQASASAAAGDAADGLGADHADCGQCHGGACASFPALPLNVAAMPPQPVQAGLQSPYRSHTPPTPERPDRSASVPAA
ncbi:MAG: hypothetical protein QM750_28095 [Rubrivivax sp.]